MNTFWTWFLIGLVPYHMNQQQVRSEWGLQVRALFWSLEIYIQRYGKHRFILHVPLIQRLQNAAWAVLLHLREDGPPHE